ncbi:NS2 [Hirame aquareovirus]|nr:NS2 [Hirame aquareovirus]
MASTSANLINQERTDRVSRLLEEYPTLMITVRQDVAGRGLIATTYSASGLNGALRLLNPLAAFKNMHAPNYVRPDPDAARPPPIRTLIGAGLDSTMDHNKQIPVTQMMRDLVLNVCADHAEDVLPTGTTRIAPLALASRVCMFVAGLHPITCKPVPASATALAIAFTSRVLGIFVDVDNSCVSMARESAERALSSVDNLQAVITNYGYDVRGNVRRDGPTCLSPNDLAEEYSISWIGLVVFLIARQVELDLDAVGLATADRATMAPHAAALEFLIRKLQWLSPFSSRLNHLVSANAQSPFRTFDDLVRVWQKPNSVTLPDRTIKLNGPALEVIANGALMYKIGATMVGGM